MRVVLPRLAELTTAEIVRRCDAAAVPAGPINNLAQVFADPQVRHLQLERRIAHPEVGQVSMPGIPYRLSRTPADVFTPPPVLGQHTEEVLREIGLTGE